MSIPNYQVGDLIILKQNLWKDDIVRTGVIVELMFHSTLNPEKCSFLVRFENAHPLIRNRIVWHDDVLQYFPVVK